MLLVLALLLTGQSCSHDASAPTADQPRYRADRLRVVTTVHAGSVTGHLTKPRRRRAVSAVGHVVDGWFTASYLAGDYPRAGFPAAFAGFTDEAERQARRDRDVTSNAAVGDRIETVTATEREVRVDLLSSRGRPVTATARIRLRFRTQGAYTRTVRVTGRLLLRRNASGRWRVFGYDLARGEA